MLKEETSEFLTYDSWLYFRCDTGIETGFPCGGGECGDTGDSNTISL